MIDRLLSSIKANVLAGSIGAGGRFVVMGWTKAILPPELEQVATSGGLDYHHWDYGRYGSLFLLSAHPDIACTDEAVVVKLGLTHSESFESLGAGDLLDRGLISARGVNPNAIRGGALVFCLSQRELAFCIYQSLVSSSHLYYWRDADTVICSDTLRCVAAIAAPLEFNPDAAPQHLLYRTVSGDETYFKDIYELLPGHLVTFVAGDWRSEQIERLDDLIPEHQLGRLSEEIVSEYERRAEQVVGSYVRQVGELGHSPGILLSGGVDSTLLASLVKSNLAPHEELRSMSYAMRVPSFTDEVNYAQHAVGLLGANHTFVDVFPADYGPLLEQTTDLLARPIGHEQAPCYLAMARSLGAREPRYVFSGTAGDMLFGNPEDKRLLQVQAYRHVPGAARTFGLLGRLLGRVLPNKAYGMREIADMLPSLGDPLSFYAPANHTLFTNLEMFQRCFGLPAVHQVIERRQATFGLYWSNPSLVEQVHFIDFPSGLHREMVCISELFRAYALERAIPFLDTDLVRFSLTLKPNIRFYANGRAKWLPKQLVESRVQSKATQWPKRGGGFDHELFDWMEHGVLRDMVCSIDRPAYMSATDFTETLDRPDWFTWNLLMLDLFEKRLLKTRAQMGDRGQPLLVRDRQLTEGDGKQ